MRDLFCNSDDDSNASTYAIVSLAVVVGLAVILVIYFKSGLCKNHKEQGK